MSILKFRHREQAGPDPFFAEPVTRPMPRRFADPHGIATDETLADIRAQAEAADWHRPALIAPPSACTCGAPFGATRLSPRTATVEQDLGGCVLFRDTVQAHFVRHEHTQGAQPQDGEGWLPEAARIYEARFTRELAWIEEQIRTLPVPEFAGELQALHAAAAADTDGIGAEFDQVAERAEAGFFQARRVFHREDTAGFPAVSA